MNKTIEFIFSQNKDDYIKYLKNEYTNLYKLWYESNDAEQFSVYYSDSLIIEKKLIHLIGYHTFREFYMLTVEFASRNYNWD